jgi:hypothetical protein
MADSFGGRASFTEAFCENADEGLEDYGKTMSQIPTYVTAVPNGTEKVHVPATPNPPLGLGPFLPTLHG